MSNKKRGGGKGVVVGIVVIAVLLAGAVALSWYTTRTAGPTAELAGTVSYRERIALPEGSVVEVQIRDVSRADAAADVVAETSITTRGENVPIPFTITYDPSQIDTRMTYAVFARILMNDSVRWITAEHVPFLENGVPVSNVDLMLVSAGGAGVLDGQSFRLVSFNGEDVPETAAYTLAFENGSVQAKFCNNMNGRYELSEGGLLKAPVLVSTLMFCAEPANLMDIETSFGGLMDLGALLTREDGNLTLSGGVTMVFAPAEE